jgi:hypothetical protein
MAQRKLRPAHMKRLNYAVRVAFVVAMLLCGCKKGKAPEAVTPKSNVQTNRSAEGTDSVPDAAWVSSIKLQGIGGTEARPFAIINGRTLEAGEAGRVKTAKTNVVVRCVAISNASVVVMIEGLKGERKLYLN